MRESDKLYKRDFDQSTLYHCNRIYNIHIFVDMKCSAWCSVIKQGNQTPAQQGPIALQCLQGEESCAPSSTERLPGTRGLVGRPQQWEGKAQPRESGAGGRGRFLLSDTSQAGSREKAISPSISGEAKKPGGVCEALPEGKGGLGEAW